MVIGNRIKRIEQKLGVKCNIYRTFLILGPPEGAFQTEAEKAEVDARIERRKQELIRQNPKCPFFLIV
jgi:hypothetical protein